MTAIYCCWNVSASRSFRIFLHEYGISDAGTPAAACASVDKAREYACGIVEGVIILGDREIKMAGIFRRRIIT